MKHLLILTLCLCTSGLLAQNVDFDKYLIPKEKIGVHNRTFKLDGFYYSKHIHIKSINDTARYIAPVILYKNGTGMNFDYIGNGYRAVTEKDNNDGCTLAYRSGFDSIIKYFKCYSKSIKKRILSNVFSIDGNSIRIQHLGVDYLIEMRGVIINDSTFLINNLMNYKTKEVTPLNHIYQFQASTPPESKKIKPNATIRRYFF